MSLTNLSVVFAPGLLRYPKGTDPLTVMVGSTFFFHFFSLPWLHY